jgi:hypothetical protein
MIPDRIPRREHRRRWRARQAAGRGPQAADLSDESVTALLGEANASASGGPAPARLDAACRDRGVQLPDPIAETAPDCAVRADTWTVRHEHIDVDSSGTPAAPAPPPPAPTSTTASFAEPEGVA